LLVIVRPPASCGALGENEPPNKFLREASFILPASFCDLNASIIKKVKAVNLWFKSNALYHYLQKISGIYLFVCKNQAEKISSGLP